MIISLLGNNITKANPLQNAWFFWQFITPLFLHPLCNMASGFKLDCLRPNYSNQVEVFFLFSSSLLSSPLLIRLFELFFRFWAWKSIVWYPYFQSWISRQYIVWGSNYSASGSIPTIQRLWFHLFCPTHRKKIRKKWLRLLETWERGIFPRTKRGELQCSVNL